MMLVSVSNSFKTIIAIHFEKPNVAIIVWQGKMVVARNINFICWRVQINSINWSIVSKIKNSNCFIIRTRNNLIFIIK